MIKPIAVVYIPRYALEFGMGIANPSEIAAGFNGEESKFTFNRELYKDYLWFCFPTDNEFKIEVFHPKDFTEIQYNELKELITNEIKNLKTKH